MRTIVILLVLCSTDGLDQLWPERDPLADAATSGNGFVTVEMPAGATRGKVLVLAPRNCPFEQARRTDVLVRELEASGIPVVRHDSMSFDLAGDTADQRAGIDRAVAVFKRGAPAVFVNGMAMSDPTAAQVAAEYRATAAGTAR